MEINKNNLVLSFIAVLICICLQLCLWENEANAGMFTDWTNPYDPPNGATNVPVDKDLSVTWTENWKTDGPAEGGRWIKIYVNGGALFESYPFPDYPPENISGIHTKTLTINPTANLQPNTMYVITIADLTIFADNMNNWDYTDGTDPPFMNSNDLWRFTTAAACYPGGIVCCATPAEGHIKWLSPPDTAHFMQVYEGLSITFNGNTAVGSGNITIKKYSDDSVVETIDVTSNRVTGWGTPTITIDPVGDLANDTHYYVNFPIDGYRTSADKDSWDFWTKATPNTFSGTGL